MATKRKKIKHKTGCGRHLHSDLCETYDLRTKIKHLHISNAPYNVGWLGGRKEVISGLGIP